MSEERNLIPKCKLLWIKDEDENTNFFHIFLSARKRNSLISVLLSSNFFSYLRGTEEENKMGTFYVCIYFFILLRVYCCFVTFMSSSSLFSLYLVFWSNHFSFFLTKSVVSFRKSWTCLSIST